MSSPANWVDATQQQLAYFLEIGGFWLLEPELVASETQSYVMLILDTL